MANSEPSTSASESAFTTSHVTTLDELLKSMPTASCGPHTTNSSKNGIANMYWNTMARFSNTLNMRCRSLCEKWHAAPNAAFSIAKLSDRLTTVDAISTPSGTAE